MPDENQVGTRPVEGHPDPAPATATAGDLTGAAAEPAASPRGGPTGPPGDGQIGRPADSTPVPVAETGDGPHDADRPAQDATAGTVADTSDASPGDASAGGTLAVDESGGVRRKPRKRANKQGSFLRELPVLLVIAFVLAVLIKSFLVAPFFIPSESMEKTLHGCAGCAGDKVLANKLVYRFHDPRPGDIVVFRGSATWAPESQVAKPSNPVEWLLHQAGSAIGVIPSSEKDFVKRVIAVGGQTVKCCDANGRVTVDGRPLDEPYVYISEPDGYQPMPFGPITVPKGRLWVMGDHRDGSADSRAHITDPDHGTIAVDDVVGKAFVIVWPVSRWSTLGTPATFADAGGSSGTSMVVPVLIIVVVVVLGVVAGYIVVRRRRSP
jgi:signal peptidase I